MPSIVAPFRPPILHALFGRRPAQGNWRSSGGAVARGDIGVSLLIHFFSCPLQGSCYGLGVLSASLHNTVVLVVSFPSPCVVARQLPETPKSRSCSGHAGAPCCRSPGFNFLYHFRSWSLSRFCQLPEHFIPCCFRNQVPCFGSLAWMASHTHPSASSLRYVRT